MKWEILDMIYRFARWNAIRHNRAATRWVEIMKWEIQKEKEMK